MDTQSAKFTWNDIVVVADDAPSNLRPKVIAWIVGVTPESMRFGSFRDEFPSGLVYTIEFEDGSSASASEDVLALVPENSPLLTPR